MDTFGTLIVSILEFVIAIGILIFLHELGHFVMARIFKIEVEEFGFGFPPRLVRLFHWKGTDFTLNWIPFGAFVRPKGENDPSVPGGLSTASPWVRLSVFLGGPVMNLVAGVFLFSLVFSRIGAPDLKTVVIMDVSTQSPAAIAGLLPGDTILKMNDQPIDDMNKLSAIVQENLGKPVTITYLREETQVTVQAVPRPEPPEGEGALGIVMANPNVPISWLQAIPFGTMIAFEQGRQLLLLPARLIQGQIAPEQARFVGPKGMFDIYQQARERDQEGAALPQQATPPAVNTLWLMAIISVALGITNLLPIPALDGGRILFILPEIILRRRVPAEYENMVHLIGFASLIMLMIYITAQDIVNPIQLP